MRLSLSQAEGVMLLEFSTAELRRIYARVRSALRFVGVMPRRKVICRACRLVSDVRDWAVVERASVCARCGWLRSADFCIHIRELP